MQWYTNLKLIFSSQQKIVKYVKWLKRAQRRFVSLTKKYDVVLCGRQRSDPNAGQQNEWTKEDAVITCNTILLNSLTQAYKNSGQEKTKP